MSTYQERHETLTSSERRANLKFRKAVERALTEYDKSLGNIESRRSDLENHRDDREVLVRTTPGPAPTVFHSESNHCGRVSDEAIARGRYRRMLEFEATMKSLAPCSACRW